MNIITPTESNLPIYFNRSKRQGESFISTLFTMWDTIESNE